MSPTRNSWVTHNSVDSSYRSIFFSLAVWMSCLMALISSKTWLKSSSPTRVTAVPTVSRASPKKSNFFRSEDRPLCLSNLSPCFNFCFVSWSFWLRASFYALNWSTLSVIFCSAEDKKACLLSIFVKPGAGVPVARHLGTISRRAKTSLFLIIRCALWWIFTLILYLNCF